MSNYIIPDGWNPMTEPWESDRRINVLSSNGEIVSVSTHATKISWIAAAPAPTTENDAYIAWQYSVPLEKKRRFEVRLDNTEPDTYYVFDSCLHKYHAHDIVRKDVAEMIAKYLEENEQ